MGNSDSVLGAVRYRWVTHSFLPVTASTYCTAKLAPREMTTVTVPPFVTIFGFGVNWVVVLRAAVVGGLVGGVVVLMFDEFDALTTTTHATMQAKIVPTKLTRRPSAMLMIGLLLYLQAGGTKIDRSDACA